MLENLEKINKKGLLDSRNFGKKSFRKSQAPSWGKLLGEEEKPTEEKQREKTMQKNFENLLSLC
jgi:hypothetical protein